MKDEKDNIYTWAEKFSFEELSLDKQSNVLEEMSKEEYDDLHEMVVSSRSYLEEEQAELVPSKVSYETLRSKLDNTEKNTVAGFFTNRVPFYQAAAAVFLAILGTYIFVGYSIDNQPIAIEHKEPIYQVIRDTIIEHVPVIEYVTKTVVKEVPVSLERSTISIDYEAVADFSRREVVDMPRIEDIAKSFGNTAVSSDELERFKVQM